MADGSPAALVTGGGTGIGAAVARRLARDGHRVAVCGRRRAPLEAVAAETGGLALDIADEEHAARCVDETVAAFGRLDGLVLNAGIVRAAPLAEVVAWLLSPAGSYVTGTTLPVDGGSSTVDVGTLAFGAA